MATQIYTHCRACITPVPVDGFRKQDVTCGNCGTRFLFLDDGPIYLAPPPGQDGMVYELKTRDGEMLRIPTEKPPLPGQAPRRTPADYPATLTGSQKRAVMVEIADKAMPGLVAQGALADDEGQDVVLLLQVARDLFETEASGELPNFLAQYQVTVPEPEPEVPSEPGSDAENEEIVSGTSHPDWTPLMAEAMRAAGRVILRRVDRGESLTQRDMDVERAYQRARLEHRDGAMPPAEPATSAAAGYLHCPKCAFIVDAPAAGETAHCPNCAADFAWGPDTAIRTPAPEAITAVEAARRHVAEAAESAVDDVVARVEGGEKLSQIEVLDAVLTLNSAAEERELEARRTGSFTPPGGPAAVDPGPDVLERDPRWSDAEYAARQAAWTAVQKKLGRGEAMTPEQMTHELTSRLDAAVGSSPTWRPEEHAARAPTPTPAPSGSETTSGWIVFAVGFAMMTLAFPLSGAISTWNEITGIVVLLGLALWGLSGTYKGLMEALELRGKTVVTVILTFVAVNVSVMGGLAIMAALGMQISETPVENATAANTSTASNAVSD